MPSGILRLTGPSIAGNLELVAQRGLGKADGDDAVQVVALALEEFVRPDGEHHVEVALGTAMAARVAFAGVADAGSVLDAGRHFDVELEFVGRRGSRRGRFGRDRR